MRGDGDFFRFALYQFPVAVYRGAVNIYASRHTTAGIVGKIPCKRHSGGVITVSAAVAPHHPSHQVINGDSDIGTCRRAVMLNIEIYPRRGRIGIGIQIDYLRQRTFFHIKRNARLGIIV